MANSQLLSTLERTNVSWLYVAKVDGSSTSLNFVQEQAGGATSSLVGSLATSGRLAWVPWENKIYLGNKDVNLSKLQGKSLDSVNTSDTYKTGTDDKPDFTDRNYREVCAKYLVASDDHLMLGNVVIDGNESSLMLIWSDLYDPDTFVVDSSTEAGYYVMPAQGKEIMGLAYCRGYTNIFTRKGIKAARYVGYSNGIYEFTDISNDVGCGYHYSVISGKDAVFFAGNDNFYILDGNEVQPIGDAIWKMFQDTLSSSNVDLVGTLDEDTDIVSWRFLANGSNGTTDGLYYNLTYNYREQKWSLRDTEGILDVWSSKVNVVTAITCDEINTPCSYYVVGVSPRLCSEFVRAFNFNKLFLVSDSFLEESETTKDGINGAGREFFLETKDLTFTITDTSVRFNHIRLICDHSNMLGSEATATGSYLEASVGYKNNLANAYTWTDYIKVSTGGTDKREVLFRFRKYNITGKLFRVRLRAKHVTTSFLNTLSSCQFSIEIPDEQSSSYVTR